MEYSHAELSQSAGGFRSSPWNAWTGTTRPHSEFLNLTPLLGEFSRDQEDYFDHLCTLIERYDAGHVKWPKISGLEMLKYLLENHGMNGADLSRLLGASRQLGPMILRGDREITAEHARALGKHFALSPGVFIE